MRMRQMTPYTARMRMRSETEDDWLGTGEVAWLLGVSRSTVLRRLTDPAQRAKWWPREGEDWRIKPLSEKIYQVRRSAVERLRT